MLKKIEDFLIKYNVSEKSLLVAFSGGYDSTVLMHILLQFSEKYNFTLAAVHLNHNWRGEESDKEQIFCQNFCETHKLQFFTKKLDKGTAKNELEAREARYKFFEEVYRKNEFDYLLTAHTKSDNAETLIFRLAKGTGINGLKGIQEYVEFSGMRLLRPLINVSRAEIEEYIEKNNLEVNFDSSNKNKKYKRNKVRIDIVPHFKELSDVFEDNMLNTSKIAEFYDKSIDYFLQKDKILQDKILYFDKFFKYPTELKYICLYKFLAVNNIKMNFEQIKLLLQQTEGNIPKSGNYFSISKDKFVLITPKSMEIVIKKDYDISNYKVQIESVKNKPDKFPNGENYYIYADKSVLKAPLHLRKRNDGDVFQPFGMKGKMKLKKFLNMKAVPKFERDNLVLLTNSDNEILWIYPLATSELVRVKDDNFVRVELKND